jgi:hypothetical protein
MVGTLAIFMAYLGFVASIATFIYDVTLPSYTAYATDLEFPNCPSSTIAFFNNMQLGVTLAAVPLTIMALFDKSSIVANTLMSVGLFILSAIGTIVLYTSSCHPLVKVGIQSALIVCGIIGGIFFYQAICYRLYAWCKRRVKKIDDKKREFVENVYRNRHSTDTNGRVTQQNTMEMSALSKNKSTVYQPEQQDYSASHYISHDMTYPPRTYNYEEVYPTYHQTPTSSALINAQNQSFGRYFASAPPPPTYV